MTESRAEQFVEIEMNDMSEALNKVDVIGQELNNENNLPSEETLILLDEIFYQGFVLVLVLSMMFFFLSTDNHTKIDTIEPEE